MTMLLSSSSDFGLFLESYLLIISNGGRRIYVVSGCFVMTVLSFFFFFFILGNHKQLGICGQISSWQLQP